MPITIVQNKISWRTASIQKKQNESSERVFPFYYECVCLMMTYCPTNSGGGIWSHFSSLTSFQFVLKHTFGRLLVRYLYWSRSKLTSAWQSGKHWTGSQHLLWDWVVHFMSLALSSIICKIIGVTFSLNSLSASQTSFYSVLLLGKHNLRLHLISMMS